ncbi:MAG: phosphotransferase system, mannose/fructose/N-acetylgalactosamine-specific component [Firmicutes bacterium]|nr:phosphotransferase system, mannose/fructose/N-acetylgalactosamine-specific component [Bacillota bacterium]
MYKDKALSADESKMLTSVFWRQHLLVAGINHVRMQGLAYAWILKNALKKLYTNEADYYAAMKRHTQFFNTAPQLGTFIMGLSLSMEKEKAEGKDIDDDAINAVKVGLMGPFAGIGDSFFQGTLRIIATGVGLGLSQAGNILGIVLFSLIYSVPMVWLRYYGLKLSYMLGSKYLQEAMESGLLKVITKGASILGIIMVGAMTFQMVSFPISFQAKIGGVDFVLQKVLDSICLGILPLSITLFCYWLLKKQANPAYVLIGLIVFAYSTVFAGLTGGPMPK